MHKREMMLLLTSTNTTSFSNSVHHPSRPVHNIIIIPNSVETFNRAYYLKRLSSDSFSDAEQLSFSVPPVPLMIADSVPEVVDNINNQNVWYTTTKTMLFSLHYGNTQSQVYVTEQTVHF